MLLLGALVLARPVCGSDELAPAHIFSDGLVLQRDTEAPVFGTAAPGSKVTVKFGRQKRDATAGPDGRWLVKLKSLPASAVPQELTISDDRRQTVVIANVLVGDVWLCSGQDNMQWSVKNSAEAANEIAAANYPEIRLFNVSNTPDASPNGRAARTKGDWKPCTPDNVAFFSAVAYYFGRELNQNLKVPLGLIETSWGGTRCASWLPAEAIEERNELLPLRVELQEALRRPASAGGMSDQEKRWRAFTEKFTSDESGKAQAAALFNDGAWSETALPATYAQLAGAGNDFDGEVWFRRRVHLPASFIGKEVTLSLGTIDDNDMTYFNGQKIGETDLNVPNYWLAERRYTIPAALTQSGENILAVRVFDQYATGGFTGQAENIFMQCGNERMLIGSGWRYRVGLSYPADSRKPAMSDLTPASPNTPTALFNTRIFPLIPLGIKGVIWYQGEADLLQAGLYRQSFQELIRSWRRLWDRDIPFVYAQLSSYQERGSAECKEGWPQVREAQLQCLRQSQTAMAVTIDIGQPDTLQPPNKQEVGRRLALGALRTAYERDLPFSGPLYSEVEFKDGRARLSFNQTGGGLQAREGELKGFQIAGEDRVFKPAWAQIEGTQVVVYATDVPSPAAVRYGWSDYPTECNLTNRTGLPASPFRTDNWPVPTLPVVVLPKPERPVERTVVIEQPRPQPQVIVVPARPGPVILPPPHPGRW